MDDDKRKRKQPPIPDNLEDYLNEVQLQALGQLENFGWELKFIRRPVFEKAIVVIMSGGGEKVGILEEDGSINTEIDIVIRD